MSERSEHWNSAYATKGERGVSWFEESPAFSVELIRTLDVAAPLSLIDVGGGSSRLVDVGVANGWSMAVLDISETALTTARQRLGAAAAKVEWIAEDVTRWRPRRQYDVWHDRAAFHFLIEADDREAYVQRLHPAVRPGGYAIIGTFAPDGPDRCSGLPVQRYDAAGIAHAVGDPFVLVAGHRMTHTTPWNSSQVFQFAVLRSPLR